MVQAQTWQYTSPNIGYFNYSGAKIGIGTTTPGWNFHVLAPTTDIMLEATTDQYATVNFKSNNKTWQWSKRPSFQADAMQLWYQDATVSQYFQGPFMSIVPAGSVGIGTATPQKLLHVVGSSATTQGVEAMIEATDDWYASISFKSHNKVWNWGKRPGFENDAMQLWYLDGAGGGWQGPYLSVSTNGSLGIGTTKNTDANYKLFVETGIRTRKVVVDQVTWPDYVFKPGYSLPTLSSVADYIKLNQHLPDMPSADSVVKAGVNLGDNQAQLLKKIEELTLYTIDQQQQLEELKQQNKKMQEQIGMLMKMGAKKK